MNELLAPLPGCSMHLERKFWHLYPCCGSKEVLNTKPELDKLHRPFRHLSIGKLYEVIKRAKPNQVDESTRKLLEDITRSCEICQTFSTRSQRFRVSLPPSDIVINRKIAMDFMWIDKKAALHVVDIETNFSSASFLPDQMVEGVWDAFVSCRASLYIVFPMKRRVDQGSAFTNVRWTRRSDAIGSIVQTSGVELHNSLGSGEWYHAPLCRIFNKIKHANPKMDRKIALRISVKAMNATMGPNGLVHPIFCSDVYRNSRR